MDIDLHRWLSQASFQTVLMGRWTAKGHLHRSTSQTNDRAQLPKQNQFGCGHGLTVCLRWAEGLGILLVGSRLGGAARTGV